MAEAIRFLESTFITQPKPFNKLFFFGGGYLYILDAILQSIDSRSLASIQLLNSLILYEPIEEIRYDILSSGKLKFYHEEFNKRSIQFDYLEGIEVSQFNQKEFNVFCLPFYTRNLQSEWKIFQELLQPNTKNTMNIDESTSKHFAIRWTSNSMKSWNRGKIRILSPQSKLNSKEPILFLGGSPELEEDVNLIKKIRNHCFLLASDTAASVVLKHGILPDGIINVDPGRGSIYHLAESIHLKIPIFSWMGGLDLTFVENDYPLYFFLTTHPMDQIVQQFLGWEDNRILSNPSRNISGMAKSLAWYWGFDLFLWSGVSFVSMGGKTHARGTGYESYFLPLVNRWQSLEKLYPRKTYKSVASGKNSLALKALQSKDWHPELNTMSLREWNSSYPEKNISPNLFNPFQEKFIPTFSEIEISGILQVLDCLKPIQGIHYPIIKRWKGFRFGELDSCP